MATTTKAKFMTNHGAQMDGNHAPVPAHSMDKHYYQSRMGVTPTHTNQLSFHNSAENGLWAMAPHFTPPYTPINNREPTPPEKGHAPWQATMGKVDNGFSRND
jgi:hypothetical protein